MISKILEAFGNRTLTWKVEKNIKKKQYARLWLQLLMRMALKQGRTF